MSRRQQQTFEGLKKPGRSFGGALLKNSHAKTRRPLDSKLPIHLVLRAGRSVLRGPRVFGQVRQIVDRTAARHGVRLYEFANVGNHLHLLIKIRHRLGWAAFIRELTGRLAQLAGRRGEKFWKQRPFTEIVGGWRRAFKSVQAYIVMNVWEAEGFISRKDTKTLKDLRAIWGDG